LVGVDGVGLLWGGGGGRQRRRSPHARPMVTTPTVAAVRPDAHTDGNRTNTHTYTQETIHIVTTAHTHTDTHTHTTGSKMYTHSHIYTVRTADGDDDRGVGAAGAVLLLERVRDALVEPRRVQPVLWETGPNREKQLEDGMS
jgi:hypothetical protein